MLWSVARALAGQPIPEMAMITLSMWVSESNFVLR
ncbi:MAG: hypothetical protein K0S86_1976 [Geminicoccaceae bacterium]|nr:hypothetical protein [Geminicoccaceae bacterium]